MVKIQNALIAIALGLVLASTGWGNTGTKRDSEKPTLDSERNAEKPDAIAQEPAELNQTGSVPVFVPRDTGAPLARVGGASRSMARQRLPMINALVPEQLGYTLDAQPVLYWHISEPTEYRVDFTLMSAGSATPVLEVTLDTPIEAGVNRIALEDYGIELPLGVRYAWYVSLIPNPVRRSEDRVVGGAIERIAVSPTLKRGLSSTTEEQLAFVFAQEGLWYDALRSLCVRVALDRENLKLRAQRAALFEQVGLVDVATMERRFQGTGASASE